MVYVAAGIDLKTKKIPNLLICVGALTAVCFIVFIEHLGSAEAVIRIVSVIILFFFGMLRLIGLGDIKLWMVITLFIGILRSSIIIAAASLLLVIWQNIVNNKEARRLTFLAFYQLKIEKKIVIYEQKKHAFAPYVAVATTIMFLLEVL